MNDLIITITGYNFKRNVRHNSDIRNLCKALRKQSRHNRLLTWSVGLSCICIVMLKKQLQEQRSKMELMEEDIKELKRRKGDPQCDA